MRMRIAVAGGTGQAGIQAVDVARARGHDVVVLARAAGVDLVDGEGAAAALDGVDVVIDASGVSAGDDPHAFHAAVTATLAAAKPPHIVVLSIVGADRAASYPLYGAKVAQERATDASGIPFTIARTTQFHEFAAQVWGLGTLGPLHGAPIMRTQPVAVREVGARLVDLAEAGPVGRAPDFAGPREESLVAMVRAYARATGKGRSVLPIPFPGEMGTAQRRGWLLPGTDAVFSQQTYAEWIDALR